MGICAFEYEDIRLHIFEERYKFLINECVENNLVFGIPVSKNKTVLSIGSALEVSEIIKRYPGGEMDIVCRVKFSFDLDEFFPETKDKPYASGWIKPRNYIANEDNELNLRIHDLLSELYELSDSPRIVPYDKNFSMIPYIHKAALDIDEEIEMLHLTSFQHRQLYFINHLKNIIKTLTELKKMNRLIHLNGHFKKAISEF